MPAKRNPKRHDLVELRRSIERFGIIDPIVEDGRTNRLISGHGRLETLAEAEAAGIDPPDGVMVTAGRWRVPVVIGWSSRNDAEARAALVAVNHLTETGGWDIAELVKTLDGVSLVGTAYTAPDLEQMLASLTPPTAPDTTPEPAAPRRAPKRTKPGDVWHLGDHRLICGDARDLAVVMRVLEGAAAQLVFTSPPYAEQRLYDEDSEFEPIPPAKYVAWFRDVSNNLAAVLAADGSFMLNIKEAADDFQRHRYVLDLFAALIDWDWRYVDQFVWPRPAFPIDPRAARRFKNGWEPVVHYARAADFKFRPEAVMVESDKAFTYDTNDRMGGNRVTGLLLASRDTGKGPGLAFPSNVLPNFGTASTGTDHPAAFPAALPGWFVRAYTDVGDAVLDPFAGSGSTLLAAHAHDRVGFGVELSPAYCDMICARWQDTTGSRPTRNGRAVNFER